LPDGSVLISVDNPGTRGGVQRFSKGRCEPVKVQGFDSSRVGATPVFRDHDGAIWLGTSGEGIYHIHRDKFDRFGFLTISGTPVEIDLIVSDEICVFQGEAYSRTLKRLVGSRQSKVR
jgi:hypothetical protein